MPFEYIDIQDPEYLEHHIKNQELDYVLVKRKSLKCVPINNWEPPAYCFTTRFKDYELDLINFNVKPDDIWVASYPKSGTTWCQEMVWLICNNLNYDAAKSQLLRVRFPFLEISLIHDIPNGSSSFEVVKNMRSPRFIKTHLPVSMLPDQYWNILPKTIYIRRNVKSVAVSYYHHSKNYFYRGTKEQFIRSFMRNLQFYSPIHSHVIGYHSVTGCNNILYLSYEDMKRDLHKELIKVSKFLGYNYSDEQLKSLCQHLSFNSMQNNIACNYEDDSDSKWQTKDPDDRFIRRGELDSWKTELDLELCQELDDWNHKSIKFETFRGLFC